MYKLIKENYHIKGGGNAVIEIIHDEDSNFMLDEWADSNDGRINMFSEGHLFHKAADEAGLTSKDLMDLHSGHIVTKGTDVYIGIERYSHGADVFALTLEGNFPDRNWDVSQCVGWAVFGTDEDSDVVQPYLDRPYLEEPPTAILNLRKRARSYIKELNYLVSGSIWGYVIRINDAHGTEMDHESCWGFVGEPEDCLTDAKEILKDMNDRVIWD